MLSLSKSLLRTDRSSTRLTRFSRNVFVTTHEKRYETRHKKVKEERSDEKLQRWAEQDEQRKKIAKEQEYQQKVLKFKNFTSSIASYVRHTQDGLLPKNISFNKLLPEKAEKLDQSEEQQRKEEQKQEKISKSDKKDDKKFNPKKSSINTPAMALPPNIQERLGPATRYLVSKKQQAWTLVLFYLQHNGGFAELKSREIAKLVLAIPSYQITLVFPTIETLMKDANIKKTTAIINAYLYKLVFVPVIDQDRLTLIENTIEELKARSRQGKLPSDTYEYLVEAYGKTNNISKLETVIADMKKFNVALTSKVYSSILATTVYKTKDHRQAVQLFDQMKFLGSLMAPKARDYRDIIVSYINNDDVEKALDLYEEMADSKISPDQQTLVALARGCITRLLLKLKAWDFIFEIYEKGLKPKVATLEYMLYLAARDGDLSLARGLYQQLIKLNAFNPRSLGFLMLAFASSKLKETGFVVPVITAHETGRRFRYNILDKMSFIPNMIDPSKAIPFLPKIALSSEQEVLSESSAVMTHALLFNPDAVTVQNINSFLNIAAKLGSLGEFKDRYEQFTFLDITEASKTRFHQEENKEAKKEEEERNEEAIRQDESREAEKKEEIDALNTENYTSVSILDKPEVPVETSSRKTLSTKSPLLDRPDKHGHVTKIPRSTYTYAVALKAAARHKNYGFAEQVWQERGLFRKTSTFASMSRRDKDALDFYFATVMIHALTEMDLLDDALAILISTEYQFKWTWKELIPLQKAAVEVGHEKAIRTIRGIASRAQIKYEGKIRRKDFRLYMMQSKHLY